MSIRTAIAFAALVVAASPLAAQGRGNGAGRVPPGHLPPAGMCRIWIDGVPPGRQPEPTDCATARRRVPDNARVIYGARTIGSRDIRRTDDDRRRRTDDDWRYDDRRTDDDRKYEDDRKSEDDRKYDVDRKDDDSKQDVIDRKSDDRDDVKRDDDDDGDRKDSDRKTTARKR
jgi:hypothetical protein